MKIDKRLKDKKWRLNHLYKIRDKDSNLVQFKLNDAQEHFFDNKHTRNIILKSRQLGFTTYEAIDMLDDTLFNRNFDSLQIAHTKDDAIKIFSSKVSFAWDNFPLQKLYKVTTDKANELRFDFGDNTYSSILVSNSGRSGSFQRVHISEMAKLVKKYPERADELLTGTLPSVPLHGRVDIESTAEGNIGIFYDMYEDGKDNPQLPTEFKKHFYNWTWDKAEISKVTEEQVKYIFDQKDFNIFKPIQKQYKYDDREIAYYYLKWVSVKRDWDKLHQEYPITDDEAFMSSGNKHFDIEPLNKMKIREGETEGDWIIYEGYKTNGDYLIGADVAGGVGLDHSTIVVLKITNAVDPVEVVAIYKNNLIDPTLFAHEMKGAAVRYKGALICPEQNNHGHETLAKLRDIYPNVYKFKVKDPADPRKTKKRYGWLTTRANKGTMLGDLKEAINNGLLYIPSKPLIKELKTYDREDISNVDMETGHWDLVIALAIAWQMVTKVTPISRINEVGSIFEKPKEEVYKFPKLDFS